MPATSSSAICRKPVLVHGALLVRSSRSELVATGSNVMTVAALEADAHWISALLTGTYSLPFQEETASSAGSCRAASRVKYARTVPETVCGVGQSTETHSRGCAAETAGRRAVASFL